MLKLILGRAGTGKTELIMNDFRRRMEAGESGMLLIVPEQYSHDAERRLCAVCGDALSMHGETLSFTRLCGRVFTETGAAVNILDSGGQMLVMQRALESVSPSLKVFGTKVSRADIVEKMTTAVQELKSLSIGAEALEHLAEQASYPLSDKLRDLALIYGAYDTLLHIHGGDATDRLALLAEMIGGSTIGDRGHIYIDGFNDFTAQELRVIEELLLKDAEITVCLTCDPSDDSEVFELPRITARKLKNLACGNWEESVLPSDLQLRERSPELEHLEKHLFSASAPIYEGRGGAITICSPHTKLAECEHAAAKVWEYVQAGLRWRDIGVMARDWSEYGHICENVFDKHEIPYFSGGRADILSKPAAALVDAALDIAVSGWEYKQVFRYVKTDLTGVSAEESAELENYVIKWNIRGSVWTREWTLPLSGYGGFEEEAALARINVMRLRISEPLARLRDGIKGVSGADAKLRGLYAFFEDIKLAERLSEKAAELEKRGEPRLADEYIQLWGILVNSMEQVFHILGDTRLSAAEFKKIFVLVLCGYDVGVIPVSLDRVALGSMEMSRRRDLKCLIVLGATDDNMPMLTKGGGALSDSDREEMGRLGTQMPSGLEERLGREMNMLYSTLTLPSRELVVTYPGDGGARPSFIIKRLEVMFGCEKSDCAVLPAGAKSRASIPLSTPTSGRLCVSAAESLYGSEIALSPTRVERYYSCPFQHFIQNGLKLRPRVPAEFDAPTAGIFMHYVLERVTRDIRESVGFRAADEGMCRELTARYIEEFVRVYLFGFEGMNARFVYLFRRFQEDVVRIALDMLIELKKSDFEPIDFELKISDLGAPGLAGFVDRIDGWKHAGKLFLRVIDYKTGRKAFDLSEVLYGRNMQMLIYLFALKEHGRERYGVDIAPAGVLYAPARDVILKAPRNTADDELRKLREKELRRGGLILDDSSVIEAMENGDEKTYLPIKRAKDGGFTGDSLASPEQVELLSDHVARKLSAAASEILAGDIECSPYYRSDSDNACLYCEYRPVCGFDEEAGGKRRFVRKIKPAEIWETLKDGLYE